MRVKYDFETYSELDVRDVSAYIYATHPSTEVMCVGYQIGKLPARVWYPKFQKIPGDLTLALKHPDLVVVAHNAFFEFCVHNFCLLKKYNLPKFIHEQMDCTAARARYMSFPGKLELLAPALKLNVVKDMEGHRLMLKMCKPRKATKNNSAIRHETPAQYKRLGQYCLTDVVVESKIDEILPPLPPQEREVWLLDQKMNLRGVQVDVETCKTTLRLINEYEKKLQIETKELTNGRLSSVNQLDRLLGELKTLGLFLPNLQKNTVEDYLREDAENPASGRARRLLEIRRALSKASAKKYKAFIRRSDQSGIIRDLWLYHGATTGRWSGQGIQPQNLPRGTISDIATGIEIIQHGNLPFIESLFEQPMDLFSSAIRGMFIARKGKQIVAADFNAIEARVLMWLAKQENAIRSFVKDLDLYIETAIDIFKRKLTKKDNPDERFIGKETVLGCGFQMGPPKFKKNLFDKFRKTISKELSERIVATYRAKFPNVPKLWKSLEGAACYTVRTRKRTKVKGVEWFMEGEHLRCKLPSARCLTYPYASVKPIKTKWGTIKHTLHFWGLNSYTKKWAEETTYGGKLTENIVQAIARDLMVHGMLNCEKAGYEMLLTVHDELVAEKENANLEEFKRIMTTLPHWAKGCPVKTEGWVGLRYKK